MAKEMIVSVNGREKKIAILEDGKVTEFYIERGEVNSGVVGNIYKGRVQRVLPGMQSAFVDIGLERDAFLYVSDFFDEEEEFERIVMEKSQKGDKATAEKAASDHLQRARLERERAIEAAQERIEPIVAPVEEEDEETETASAPFEFEETLPGEDLLEIETEESGTIIPILDESGIEYVEAAISTIPAQPSTEREELLTPFTNGESMFERIVDDEDTQGETGELFKEARIQERIQDQVRAVEFEVEPVQPMQVGSLNLNVSSGGFERIADDDEPAETSAGAQAPKQEEGKGKRGGRGRRGGKDRGGKKQPAEQETQTQQPAPEVIAAATAEEAPTQAEETTQPEEPAKPADGRRGKKGKPTESKAKKPTEESRKQRGRGAKKGSRKDDATAQTEESADVSDNQTVETSDRESVESSDRANESVESASGEKRRGSNVERGSRRERTNTQTETAVQEERGNSGDSSPSDAMTADYGDASASVDDLGSFRSEMAVRRGGRRRRGGKDRGKERSGQEDRTETQETEETELETAETADAPEAASDNRASGNGRGQRESRGGSRESRRAPTITDLLREGQEILVQIAKEPIAKKGARITSHIALPGRYLVYMPTIEHVGVSRKIESGSERNRLRHLIQKIRQEEDVPSGGFIVRTAGIGIPEQNLRDDARYLVRTWLDIRKGAEKAKSPALVHQDLDLVERILRDQLSDDFTAIRVDDEAEYLRVVEFINRMAPRMVNRVKLYTRDEPIMENYGVQEEIDKAVKPRVWLKSGGYLVINQTEALVSIDVNTGKFVGKGATRLEDTITKTNMEAVEEIARQIRLRDLGGIIVLDLIDMEDKRNRQRVLQALQEALQGDKSPTKVLSFNDFGLIVMTRKRVKQSLERTLCAPCPYCQASGLVKSAETVAYEILSEARRLSKHMDDGIKQTTLRVHPEVAKSLRTTQSDVLTEIEDYLGAVDVTSDSHVHQEQFDFAFI